MLTLIPNSMFSWDFRVLHDGEEIALIDREWFRERASFTVDGKTFDVRRTSVLNGTFVLEHADAAIAIATKSSIFKRAFEIAVGSNIYTLQATSVFGREFSLSQGGVIIGYFRPLSLFGRTAEATFPGTITRPVQLFLAFLVLTLWKRSAESA